MGRLTTVFLTFMFIGVAGFFATQKYIIEPLNGTSLLGQTPPPAPAACLPPISNGCACATSINCAISGSCQRASCTKDFYNGNCVYPTTQVPYIAWCYHSMTQCSNTEKDTLCNWKACRAPAPSNACSCALDYPTGGACAGGATRVGGGFQTKAACNTFCSTLPPPPTQCGGTGTSCNGGTCPTGSTCSGAAGVACSCVATSPPPPPPTCGGPVTACGGPCPISGQTCRNVNGACACAAPPNCRATGLTCTNTGGACPVGTSCRRQSGLCGCHSNTPPPPPPPTCTNKTVGPVDSWGASGPAMAPGWQIAPNPVGTFITDLNNAASAAALRFCEMSAMPPPCDTGCKPDTVGHPTSGRVTTFTPTFDPTDVPDNGRISFQGTSIQIIPAKVAPPPKAQQRAKYVRGTCNATLYCIPN